MYYWSKRLSPIDDQDAFQNTEERERVKVSGMRGDALGHQFWSQWGSPNKAGQTLSRRSLKVARDGAETTSAGRSFQSLRTRTAKKVGSGPDRRHRLC